MSTGRTDRARLVVDLDAVAANYRALARRASGAECAGVVKADAYGLGLAEVGRTLADAGCRTFFVAYPAEGTALRTALGAPAERCAIFVLDGDVAGDEATYDRAGLVPVLGTIEAIDRWAGHARAKGGRKAALMIDSGMARLGLGEPEIEALAAAPGRLDGLTLTHAMSHLACADEPENPMNAEQRARFDSLRGRLGPLPASLANSAGVFLGAGFHYDLVRPGAALYGLAVVRRGVNPMAQAARVQAKIVQLRHVDRDTAVGYGATRRIAAGRFLATVAIGYADGFPRSLSNRGSGRVGDVPVPVVGRVSMDLVTFDVTGVATDLVRPGAYIDLIGPGHDADALASEAGTIGYEILSRIGPRVHRVYRRASGGGVA